MATIKDSAPRVHPSTRKARTNRGKFGSLERRYFQGRLDDVQEEDFERLCLDMSRLYKNVSA